MEFENTITHIKTDNKGKIIFIGGSCKAKDLKKNIKCRICESEKEIFKKENFLIREGLNNQHKEKVTRINCSNCGNLKYAEVKKDE